MKVEVTVAELVSALADAGLEQTRQLEGEYPVGHRAVIAGRCQLDDHELDLRVWVPDDFPLSLPTVVVANHEVLGFVPHLTANGAICYHEGEGSVQSIWRPAQVIVEAMELALKVLRESLDRGDAKGIVEEMEWWWSRQGDCWRKWVSEFVPGEQVKAIHRFQNCVFDNRLGSVPDGLAIETGLYIPFGSTLFEARLDPRELLAVGRLRTLLRQHLSEDNRKLLKARLRRGAPPRFLVLGIMRPSGDRALIGAEFEGKLDPHPLRESAMTTTKMSPALIDRVDRRRLLERGGANLGLSGKRVAIAGVGAVGGYVADAVARSGIGELILVDPDVLLPENMYRHTLGCPRLSQVLPIAPLFDMATPVPKAHALAQHLANSLMHLNVKSCHVPIQAALRDPALGPIDLLIVAIGKPTVSRGLNLELRARGGPRAVYTWLEPLGVGGHALLTATPGQPGCYECLFIDDTGAELLAPGTDFVAPDQYVLRRVGGCGTSYTPFSDLDARRTAELAVRLAIEALTGAEPEPCLRSWRGRVTDAARNLLLTPRYHLTQDQLNLDPRGFVRSECRVCGPGHHGAISV